MDFKSNTNFNDFCKLYQENSDRVIFFVGAGLSIPLFPSWKKLLTELVIYIDTKGKLKYSKDELLEKIDNGINFLEIAETCVEAIGKNEFQDFLEKKIDIEFSIDEIPESYKLLLSMQFKSIITTNYDRIPELGCGGKYNCYTNKNISEGIKAIEKGKKVVIKIHGDILIQDTIIFTESDFKNIIHNNLNVQNSLRSIFSTSTICFLGFGFNDPHFNLLLDYINAINSGKTVIHYALLPTKSKFEIDSIEKKYGLRVIEYTPSNESHIEVTQFISELKGIKPIKEVVKLIDDFPTLINIIEINVNSILSISSYYINYIQEAKTLVFNYFTRANSEYEQQKEIISIFNQCALSTNLIESIRLCIFARSKEELEYVKFSPLILVSEISYSTLIELKEKRIKIIDFWNQIDFKQPYMVGNVYYSNREVNFPYINF